jgi:hypothetical protein
MDAYRIAALLVAWTAALVWVGCEAAWARAEQTDTVRSFKRGVELGLARAADETAKEES